MIIRKLTVIWIFLYFFNTTYLTADERIKISYSVVPLLEKLPYTYSLEKYPQNYINQMRSVIDKKNEKIRFVTYNILFDVFDHQLKDKTYSWAQRFPYVVASIKNMQADILCLQEAYPKQVEDLKSSLGQDFASFVGKSTQGELNVIFYRKDRFVLDTKNYAFNALNLANQSLELPLNPQDNALITKKSNFLPPHLEPGRQLTLANFYDHLTGKRFTVLNTHLTFYRINSREDQASFIKDLVQDLYVFQKAVILCGDFNTFPNRPSHLQFPFYDGDHICSILQQSLKESKGAALLGHIGPSTTALVDFSLRANKPFDVYEDSDVILDHIFVSNEIDVLIHATEPCQINDRFPSDHMPVIADILLP